jgi:hypothetical protein
MPRFFMSAPLERREEGRGWGRAVVSEDEWGVRAGGTDEEGKKKTEIGAFVALPLPPPALARARALCNRPDSGLKM